MKRALLLIVCSLMVLQGSLFGQQTLEWLQKASFDTIHYPGQRHVFKQFCIAEIDSVIVEGTATFSHAELKNIGLCVYRQTFHDTIITEVEIATKGKMSKQKLQDYYKSLIKGDYHPVLFDRVELNTGTIERNGILIQAVFITDRKGKNAKIILTEI